MSRSSSTAQVVYLGVFGGMLALTLIAWWPVHDGWFLLDDYRWLPPTPRRFDLLKSFVGPWGHSLAYRPLMRLSFFADLQLFGLDPRGWHLHSFVLHSLNATLLFSLIRVTTGRWVPALGISVLFVVSPLGHENVAWISGRTFLLGGSFFLLSSNLLVRSIMTSDRERSRVLFRWGAAAWVLALATYEPVVILPLLAIVTVRLFPSLSVVEPEVIRKRITQLFLILIVFMACRFVFLKGNIGAVNPTSWLWVIEPLRYWIEVWIVPGHVARIVAPLVLGTAFVISLALIRQRPAIAPTAARRLPLYLVVSAFVLFLPFINVVGIADRFLYLVQATFIATIITALWLIARWFQAGNAFAVTSVLILTLAGVIGCRQAARDWAGAGLVVRSIADDIKRLYPIWPSGVDVVLEGVPERVGRADVYVHYTKEAVFQNHGPVHTRVFVTHELSLLGNTRAPDSIRPAKYFRFDPQSLTLLELNAPDAFGSHAIR